MAIFKDGINECPLQTSSHREPRTYPASKHYFRAFDVRFPIFERSYEYSNEASTAAVLMPLLLQMVKLYQYMALH